MELNLDIPFYPAYGIFELKELFYVYYRGFDPLYPAISERPAYFGTRSVAEGYARKHGNGIRMFTNSHPLKLIDVRFMKDLLRYLFATHSDGTEDILSTILSFGICSLSHQIELAKIRFKSLLGQPQLETLEKYYKKGLFEQEGVRIAETENDAQTMGFLKGLFEGVIDGFVSPQTYSPFHTEKPGNMMVAELIIFNPLRSGIKMIMSPLRIVGKETISEIYNKRFGSKFQFGIPPKQVDFFMKTGGGTADESLPSVEMIDMSGELFTKGYDAGKRWNTLTNLGFEINIFPKIKVSSWNLPSVRRMTRKNKSPTTS